jgi:hypothetical protein
MPQFGPYLTIIICDCKSFIVQATGRSKIKAKDPTRKYLSCMKMGTHREENMASSLHMLSVIPAEEYKDIIIF